MQAKRETERVLGAEGDDRTLHRETTLSRPVRSECALDDVTDFDFVGVRPDENVLRAGKRRETGRDRDPPFLDALDPAEGLRDDRLNHRQGIFHAMRHLTDDIGLATLERVGVFEGSFLFGDRASQFDLCHRLVREKSQRADLMLVKRTRAEVQNAHGPDRQAGGGPEERSGVEAQTGFAGDQRVGGEARIERGVRHDHHVLGQDRVAAKRRIERGLAHAESGLGHEELP